MRPQLFSCGIGAPLHGARHRSTGFNEAAAIQLRNQSIHESGVAASHASMRPQLFSCGIGPRASLRAAWAFGKGCETCRKPRRHMGTECSHASVNKTQIPDCERTIVVRALPGKCAITGALAPGGEIRRSRAHARPARNPCPSLPPGGRRGRRGRHRRRECDPVHGE